jgi:enoyl-CoA hydratase/carnithine racemase
MGPADAIFAGFADHFIPQDNWPKVIRALCDTGDVSAIAEAAGPVGPAPLLQIETQVNEFFRGEYFGDIVNNLNHTGGDFAEDCIKKLARSSPLAMAATIELIHRVRGLDDIALALGMEYRFTYRAAEHGDFIEGIRAMVIDKDKFPKWRHAMTDPLLPAASAMLRPLGAHSLDLTET